MTTKTKEVTIPAPLVRYLRRGLKRRLASMTSTLYVQLETRLTLKRWKEDVKSFADGCALLDRIGPSDHTESSDVTVDLRRWGKLVLRSLEDEYRDGVERIRDAERDKFNPALIAKDVPALGELVGEIRKRAGLRPRPRRARSPLEQKTAERRIQGRRRDSGEQRHRDKHTPKQP